MHFSRTFPKTLLVLLLVFCSLFIAAAPIYAQDGDSGGDSGDDSGGVLEGIFGVLKHGLLGPLGGLSLILDKAFGVDVFDSIVGKTVGGVASGLAGAIVKIFAALINSLILITTVVLFEIGGELIGTALTFNSKIAAIAEGGYSITLGIANMLFIVALVVIAFATMLRQENFGYKKALPRVVIAALLINFGFFIVTKWLIAPVDQITTAINSATHLNPGSLGKLFSVDNLFGQFSSFKGVTSMTNNIADIAKSMMSILLAATFSFIGIISIFAMAIMLFIRGIALSILLILLPIAWVAWIFPNLKIPGGSNPWSMWWENFTRWLLFAPFAMFFFWLAISLASKGELFPDASTSLYSAAGQMIVTSGLILGGLLVSNKMGITGASIALGTVAAGRVWAQGKAKKYGRKAGYETLKRAFPRERLQTLEKVGAKRGFMARHLTAPIRAAGRRAGITTTALTSAREVEFRKKIEGLEPFQISDMYSGLNEEERAYALKYMIEKGYDWELAEGARDDILNWANKGYFDKNMYGLKKAELDLIDTGISPDAIAAQAKYKGKLRGAYKEFKKAKAEGAPKEELQAKLKEMRRIKYEGQEETKEALYKNLNVVPASGFAKFQRRMMSAPKFNAEKGIWETPYAMYSGSAEDKNDFLEMQGMLVDYMHEKRPAAINRMRGALRGDGTARMSRGTQEHVPKFLESFVDPLLEAHERMTGEKLTREEFAKQREQQLQRFTDYWHNIQEYQLAEAERYANEQARRQGTTKEEIDAIKSRILEKKQTEIRQMTPGEIAGYYQQLLLATRGSVNLAYAG